MRDHVLFYINGKEHRVSGAEAFLPLTDYLRYQLSACGTKVVCAEGDCGACTVAIGRVSGKELKYKPVNGCIQYVYQLDSTHIITVEGVKDADKLNPVQDAMVQCHGAQCGYCTPGFIVAMCSMFDSCPTVDRDTVKESLSGNLCRCTGYVSIIEAALAVDKKKATRFSKQYPDKDMVQHFNKLRLQPVRIEANDRVAYLPTTIAEAVAFKKEHPKAVIISGGTDVCVTMNKRGFEPPYVLSLGNIQGLNEIRNTGNALEIGAKVPLRELEEFVKEPIPELYKVLFVFGSPQIRWAGTLAGNIINASPIADTIPFLFIMNAEIEVVGVKRVRRVKINTLYKGYKDLALEPEEIVTRIIIPLPDTNDMLKLYKVSKREHLDISSFTAAMRMKNDNGKIAAPAISYGGVGPVILRLPKTEEFLTGKPFELETFKAAGAIAREEITPISDVRGSSDFRYQLAENVLVKYFYETAGERELVCR